MRLVWLSLRELQSKSQMYNKERVEVDLVAGHLGEGLLQLLSDSLELVLLRGELVFQPVNLGQREGN